MSELRLRERCLFSPALFNVCHGAMLKDFRIRRERTEEAAERTPGILSASAVDGRLTKRGVLRTQDFGGRSLGQSKRHRVIGDVMFADDTASASFLDEAMAAENKVALTMHDWEERINRWKAERLTLSAPGRRVYCVWSQSGVDKER